MMGLACIVSCLGLGFVGGYVLHPDFGVDKTNKNIRYVSSSVMMEFNCVNVQYNWKDFACSHLSQYICYRLAHKLGARVVLLLAWFTAFMGINSLNADPVALAIFGVPLMVIAPLTLL